MFQVFKALITQSVFGKILGYVPLSKVLFRKLIWRRLPNTFFGVYGSYQDASAAQPQNLAKSWDDAEVADEKAGHGSRAASERGQSPLEREPAQPSFYATHFWLKQFLSPNMTIVDYGGAGGDAYDLFHRHDTLPEGVVWHVVETPSLAEVGRKRIEAEGLTDLTFGSALEDVESCDILLAAGVLQYVSPDESNLLERLTRKPRYVLLNKMPLHDGEEYWSLQNISALAATPYRFFNRGEVICYYESRGYRLVDRWLVAELAANIPFAPERQLPHFEGLLFERLSS